jgi:uncharacterized protein YegP (UPF0339 family)
MHGYYEVYQDRSNGWRWRYVSLNGRIISDSGESYFNKTDCLNGIAIMKASANSPVRGA